MICGDSGAAASDGAARRGNVRAAPDSGGRSAATHACNAWVIATWKMEERSPSGTRTSAIGAMRRPSEH